MTKTLCLTNLKIWRNTILIIRSKEQIYARDNIACDMCGRDLCCEDVWEYTLLGFSKIYVCEKCHNHKKLVVIDNECEDEGNG